MLLILSQPMHHPLNAALWNHTKESYHAGQNDLATDFLKTTRLVTERRLAGKETMKATHAR